MLIRLFTLACQLLIVAAAVFAADALTPQVNFIPRWLIRLPIASYSSADFWTVLWFFLGVHLVVLGLMQFIVGPWRPAEARRTVDELFALAVGFATSALLVFVTTTVAFVPNFIVGIAVCAVLLTVLVHGVARLRTGGAAGAVGDFLGALLRRAFSVPGILVLVFALSPGVLAKVFVSNRDVANVITEIRIRVASLQARDWAVANALGGQTFRQPILVQFPPHDPGTIYVLERGGRVLRMPWGGGPVTPEVVLDINEAVGYVEVENGALGFAFHPRFGRADAAERDHVFLYYTSVIDGKQLNRLSRFALDAGDLAAREASEDVLILWDRKDSGFHNGGSVEFGPDGFLYVALGEMSEKESHQRIDGALVAGILRIDVDRQGGEISQPITRQPENGTTQGYFIPRDNPFVADENALGEFWAVGLRNPFRMSFDPANGNLWTGDVGSTVWEEVNLIRKGHNYQYPYVEGHEPTGRERPAQIPGLAESGPVYTYRHTAYDRAVIGGIVYRSPRHPSLQGQYVFGDNYSGKVFTLPATGDPVEQVPVIAQANQYAQRGLTSFLMSPDGEVLITTLGRATEPSGEVLKLVPSSDAPPPSMATAPEPAAVVSAAEASNLYQTNCSRCHGATGAGNGPDAPQLNVPMPDMTSSAFQQGRTDTRLLEVTRDGGAAHGLSPMMPPWGMVLSEGEQKALVELLRGFGSGSR